jgi:CBS domain-containing protein
MRLADRMTHPVVSVDRGEALGDCAVRMAALQIRHLVVVGPGSRCVGVLTDFDLRPRGRVVDGRWVPREPGQWTAGQLARGLEREWDADAPLAEVLQELADGSQDFALALTDGRPVGIFTENDAVRLAITLPAPLLPPTRELPLVEADEPALEARSRLARRRERHGLVVRDGVLVGVLSLRDVAVEDLVGERTLAQDVASPPISVVDGPGWDTARIATVLRDRRIGCLPITDDQGRPVRLVSRRTLVRALAAALR